MLKPIQASISLSHMNCGEAVLDNIQIISELVAHSQNFSDMYVQCRL